MDQSHLNPPNTPRSVLEVTSLSENNAASNPSSTQPSSYRIRISPPPISQTLAIPGISLKPSSRFSALIDPAELQCEEQVRRSSTPQSNTAESSDSPKAQMDFPPNSNTAESSDSPKVQEEFPPDSNTAESSAPQGVKVEFPPNSDNLLTVAEYLGRKDRPLSVGERQEIIQQQALAKIRKRNMCCGLWGACGCYDFWAEREKGKEG